MLKPDTITKRAVELLKDKPQLSPQALAVIQAVCESVNTELDKRNGNGRHPTIEAVKLAAVKIGLSEAEAEKFFDFYESKGWKVGKTPMVSMPHALANWKRGRQEEATKPNGAQTVLLGQEFQRCITRMATLRQNYGDHQTWCADDKAEFLKLKVRRDELKTILGIKV